MKERPILFSAPMVRALLAGEKTQTRRIVKLRGNDGLQKDHSIWRFCEFHDNPRRAVWQSTNNISRVIAEKCPYGELGDRLWVKETMDGVMGCDSSYVADDQRIVDAHPDKWEVWRDQRTLPCKVVPSIFMPRWASRITLDVTEIRVQRLQDISDEDAIAEGIEHIQSGKHLWRNYSTRRDEPDWFQSPVQSYRSLWVSINGEGSWQIDPFVWAVSFPALKPA